MRLYLDSAPEPSSPRVLHFGFVNGLKETLNVTALNPHQETVRRCFANPPAHETYDGFNTPIGHQVSVLHHPGLLFLVVGFDPFFKHLQKTLTSTGKAFSTAF